MTKKSFWKIMRRFLTNKGIISGYEISLFEWEQLLKNESKLAEILNVSYINFFLYIYIYIYIYINYIIHCKIKRDNHQVPKIVRVPGNKANPKKIRIKIHK